MGQKLEKNIVEQEKNHSQKSVSQLKQLNNTIFNSMNLFSHSSKKFSLKKKNSSQAIEQFSNSQISKSIKNVIELEILIVQRITTFLNVDDMINLQVCCQSYKTFFSFTSINSKSFIGCTMVNRHLKNNQSLNIEKKQKFEDILKRICQDPQHEWIVLFSESNILRKNLNLLNGKEILKSFAKKTLQLPKLFEEKVANCANTNFQIRAFQLIDEIRDQDFKNINNTGDYYQICFDISHVQLNHIDQTYQSIINDKLCPIQIKQVIQCIMQLRHLCKLFQTLFLEAIQSVDMLDFPLLYSICWEHYSTVSLEVEKNISEDLEYVNSIYGFEDKIVTLTDIVISIWKQTIQNQLLSEQIVNSFIKLIQKYRRSNVYGEDISSDRSPESSSSSNKLQELLLLDNYCLFPKQIVQIRNKGIDLSSLWSCIKAFIDQSSTSDQVQLLGHNNFKLCNELDMIIQQIQSNTEKSSKQIHEKYSQDIQKLTEIVEKDFELLRQIFGDWISETYIEPIHHKILNDWLVQSVAPLLNLKKQDYQFQTPSEQQMCQSLMIESKIIDSDEITQADFIASQASKSDILLSVIDHIKNPQCKKLDRGSTMDSEFLSYPSDIMNQSLDLAKQIRMSYPSVATLETFIARRRSALELNTQLRESVIESRLIFSSQSLGKNEFESIPIDNSSSIQETFFNLVKRHQQQELKC